MKSSKSPLTEPTAAQILTEIARLRPHYQSQSATDFARRQMLDHFEELANRQGATDPTPVAVNTHGLTPPVQTFRLFDLGGWRMVVEVDSDDDGEGIGIRYTLRVSDGIRMSLWLGTTSEGDDDLSEAEATYIETVAEMTNADAANALSTMLGQFAGLSVGGHDD